MSSTPRFRLWPGIFWGGQVLLLLVVLFLALGAGRSDERAATAPFPPRQASATATTLSYRVQHRHPHDPGAFTQGLLFDGTFLYESTGLRGQSTLRQVRLDSGEVLTSVPLPVSVFGEGLALLGDRLYQLSLDSGLMYIYRKEGLALLETKTVPMPGWGLTTDGHRLILSDGTPCLRFLDPLTMTTTGKLEVRDGDALIQDLDELEWIEGEIWANVWKTDLIARIDPVSGQVLSWVDLTGLHRSGPPPNTDDVLNGIAWHQVSRRLFVTGKRWNTLYELEVVPFGPALSSTSGGGGGCLLP